MATFFELPLANDFPYFVVNSSGASVPASGYKLFLYQSGTSTKITSYTDSTGGTPNANPVLLGSTGLPQSGANVVGIWVAQGQTVKAVFAPSTDTDPPSSPIWTRDFGANPPGINDPTNITAASEWIQGPVPTFISSTSFSLAGDQTPVFQVSRRVKTINSGGTIYGTILTSSFGSGITTVTVATDSGVIDSGLSSVSYGLLSITNTSAPAFPLAQNSQGADYAILSRDANKQILHPTADNNPRTYTIPANASVPFPIGTCLTFVNQINTVTIAITTDTMTLAGAGSTGSRTLAVNGIATALKITSTNWIISGQGIS